MRPKVSREQWVGRDSSRKRKGLWLALGLAVAVIMLAEIIFGLSA